jgi:PAS domain S-box-containing protein
MKIKTRLKINTYISLGAILLILFSLIWSVREISIADKNMDLVDAMRTVSFQRILLRDEYILYQEERAKAQWKAKSEELRELLILADARFAREQDKVVLQDAQKDFDSTLAGMSSVMERRAKQRVAMHARPAFNASELRQIGQVFLKAYSLSDNISRLHESVQRSGTHARNRGAFILVISMLLSVIAIIVNSTMTSRTIAKRVETLSEGVERIGSGKLDYRVLVSGDDELAALARASNEMAAKLKQTYTSIEHLQQEMVERKRIEEALSSSKAKLEAALSSMTDAVFISDAQGHFVEFNDAFATFHKFRNKEECSRTFSEYPQILEVFLPDGALAPVDMWAVPRALRGETVKYAEYTLRRKDTGETWVGNYSFAPIRDKDGVIVGSVVVARDITEHKRADEELRFHKATLEETGHIAKVGGWSFDVRTGKGFWTDEVARIHDLPPGDPITPEVGMQYYTDESHKTIKTAVQEAVDQATPYDLELELVSAKGVHKWVRTIGHPVSENGKVVSVHGSFQDITERKHVAIRLESLITDLQRSNTELEQFAYVASHDLQEPLRMVASYTQLLGERYKDRLDENANKYIHYAVDGATRMQQLINDLLTYSRIGTKGKPFTLVDTSVVLQEVLGNLKIRLDEQKAIITHDELPSVQGDAIQLAQLFQNLISNAVKFRGEEVPHVHIGAKEEGNLWQFSVKDNGIGIDPQYADRVFIIFKRLHTRQEYPGSGIGLTICKKIAERHGGEIWFESDLGKGTTFFFTIPKQGRS